MDTDVRSALPQRGEDFGSGDTAVRALRGVDWDVPLGEISMLVGQSGCGKTTLLSVITGLLDATDGLGRGAGRESAATPGQPRANAIQAAEHRLHLPAVQPAAGADRGRERGGAAVRRQRRTARGDRARARAPAQPRPGRPRRRIAARALRRPAAARRDRPRAHPSSRASSFATSRLQHSMPSRVTP